MKKVSEPDDWADIEIFTAKGARIKDPKVTILESSQFLLNAAFVHRAGISDKTHVVLGYSPTNRIITFQFTSDDQAEGALTIVQRSGSASIGTRSFFNYFLLKPKDLAGRYEPKKVKVSKIGDAWIISLNNKLPER